MIGGSLSARGSDDPAGSRPTHSPIAIHQGSRGRVPGIGARPARDGHVLDPPVSGELEHPADLRAPAEHLDRPGRLRQARGAARRRLRRHRAAGLLAPDRLRRVRPPDGDPAAEARAHTPGPNRRRRSRSTSRPRRPGTQTRSRSRPATRRCGCCSSSTSRTSPSSSGSRPESSTPTTRRNRAWTRSRAQPSQPRRSAPTVSLDTVCRPGSQVPAGQVGWPREESNLRAWIRSPPLYPLSYGAVRVCTVSCASAWWR